MDRGARKNGAMPSKPEIDQYAAHAQSNGGVRVVSAMRSNVIWCPHPPNNAAPVPCLPPLTCSQLVDPHPRRPGGRRPPRNNPQSNPAIAPGNSLRWRPPKRVIPRQVVDLSRRAAAGARNSGNNSTANDRRACRRPREKKVAGDTPRPHLGESSLRPATSSPCPGPSRP
jgi:hypothetical protein